MYLCSISLDVRGPVHESTPLLSPNTNLTPGYYILLQLLMRTDSPYICRYLLNTRYTS